MITGKALIIFRVTKMGQIPTDLTILLILNQKAYIIKAEQSTYCELLPCISTHAKSAGIEHLEREGFPAFKKGNELITAGSGMMKESMYNVYLLDEKEKKGFVYNTINRTVVHMDDEVYNLIRNNKIDHISSDVLEVLKDGGVIVDDSINELDILKIQFNRRKYNARSMKFTIIPTYACNLACKYCYQGHGDVLSSTMNDETIRRTIEFIKKNSMGHRALSVNFYGGEPLLFPKIVFRILEESKQFADKNGLEFLVTFASNGTLFTEEILEKLRDYNYKVQITLCGPKEVHDTIRVDKKGNGTYEKLMDVIKLFKKYDTAFHIRLDVDQNNYDTIKSLLEDLKERGYSGLPLAVCSIGEDFCYTKMERDIKKVNVASLTRLSKMAHDMGFKTNPIRIHNFIRGCSAMTDNFLAVDPKGDIYKCIAAPYYTEHKFGTIDENGGLIDMNYDAYCKWTLRDSLLIEECVECKFAPICAGGCALIAYVRHGDINFPGCEEKELGEIMRTFIMLEYPELFEESTYDNIVL